MKKYRNLHEYQETHLREHPEAMDSYIEEMFIAYAEDRNTAAFLASLRIIAKVKGVSDIAEKIGISRQGLQKALSEKGNPNLETFNGVMQAMGYGLVAKPLGEIQAH